MLSSRKQLQLKLRQTETQLRRVQVVITNELTTLHDNPVYQKGYRDALRLLAQTLFTTNPNRRQGPAYRPSRQQSLTHRHEPTEEDAG